MAQETQLCAEVKLIDILWAVCNCVRDKGEKGDEGVGGLLGVEMRQK